MSDEHRSEDNERYLQRQLQRRLIIRLARLSQDLEKFNLAEYISLLNNPRRYIPVSYTHLDVYKRQFIHGPSTKPSA